MEALEFKTKIKNNQIIVPETIQAILKINKNKEVRVIVLFEIDDKNNYQHNDSFVQQSVQEQFLKGYADSDSIYDDF